MKQKKKGFAAIKERLLDNYLFIVRDTETLEQVTSFEFSYAKLLFLPLGLALVALIAGFWLGGYVEGQQDIEVYDARQEALALHQKADSLRAVVAKREVYFTNIKKIILGQDSSYKDPRLVDEENDKKLVSSEALINLNDIAEEDVELRASFENVDEMSFVSANTQGVSLDQINFITPVQGVVSSDFDADIEHFGIDIACKKDEPIKSTADGTVVLSSWTEDTGYVLAIQHTDNLISIYKHNSGLVKKVGDFVESGSVVAFAGNTGELTSGPHLHFELWFNGSPINPGIFY